MFERGDLHAAQDDERRATIQVLRWTMALAVVAVGFITGASLVFLAGTPSG
jgi:hypothetical protein